MLLVIKAWRRSELTFCHRLSHGGATLTELYSHVTRSGLESAPVLLTDLRHAIMDISNEFV